MLTQITDTIRGRQTLNPRTVLGFYATVLGLMLAGGVGAVGFLATQGVADYLIPYVLAFCGAVFVVLVLGVFVVTLIDPSKLMLSQVSGTEYAAIQQRVVLGDSTSGERVELVDTSHDSVVGVEVLALPDPAEPSAESTDESEAL